ncbi:MAG: sensor histidine kinase [Terriglobales bacterium]
MPTPIENGLRKANGLGRGLRDRAGASLWRRLPHSLSARLIIMLLGAMMLTFGLLGYVNIRLHQHHLEAATLNAAERVSDLIKRSTSYHMLRNDREALYKIISTIGAEPGIVRVRIFDREGRISYSSDPAEMNHYVNKSAEACYGCHAQTQPLTRLNRPDRFRIYKPNGNRIIGVINPIENQPACSNAACHAHPAEQQILGVLDTNLSLAKTDAAIRESSVQMAVCTLIAVIGISIVTGVFIWKLVHGPVQALTAGTHELMRGELGYQIDVKSRNELGELADSFNQMSLQLRDANEEITSWALTLEERVEQKTNELKKAHEHILHVQKMASIGKMAAVVAHEVNNPLSGILTYSKLIKKWIDHGDIARSPEKVAEARQCLDLIESESRRCGELVKNLLAFSRTAPMNLVWADLNTVIERCVKLVQHPLEMNNIQYQLELAADLPPVYCDPAQIEQVILALIMNAIDAMPRGGNLWLRSRSLPQSRQVELQVRDDGVGIPAELLPKLFEPFLTTKETGKGVGLGLAISRGIIERHSGQIEVESQVGRGTTFHIFLPLEAITPAAAEELENTRPQSLRAVTAAASSGAETERGDSK